MKYADITGRLAGLGGAKWEIHAMAKAMAATGQEVLSLTIGEPDVPPAPELLEKARFALTSRPVVPDPAAAAHLDTVSRGILQTLTLQLQNATWEKPELEAILNAAAEGADIGFGKLAQPLRAALAGRTATPSVYDMMLVIGRDETIARLNEAAG